MGRKEHEPNTNPLKGVFHHLRRLSFVLIHLVGRNRIDDEEQEANEIHPELIGEVVLLLRRLTNDQIELINLDQTAPQWFIDLVSAEYNRRMFFARNGELYSSRRRSDEVMKRASRSVSIRRLPSKPDGLSDNDTADYLYKVLLAAADLDALEYDSAQGAESSLDKLADVVLRLSQHELWFAFRTLSERTNEESRIPSPYYLKSPSILQ